MGDDENLVETYAFRIVFSIQLFEVSSSSNIVQASKEYHVQAQCNTLNDLVGIYIVLCRCCIYSVY